MLGSWINLPFFRSTEYSQVTHKLGCLSQSQYCPNADKLFASLYTPGGPTTTKVLILGQDPYPTPGHANGFAFSVDKRVQPLPKSLQNIFKELVDDIGCRYPTNGDLTPWAKQGVMLLNTALSTEAWKPNAHKDWGWGQLAREVVCHLSYDTEGKVFILWGKQAQAYENYIDKDKHLVITSPHPSPLSAHLGFFGSKPFSRANKYLGENRINWGLHEQDRAEASRASSRAR